ncbi:MAG: hypothetical protein AAFU03_16180, partial [Bacteroidota bacterium]
MFSGTAFSQVSQDFEGITTALNCATNSNCSYDDLGNTAAQHFLIDNNGIPVTFVGSGNTLGFVSEYTPSQSGDGITNDAFGVATSTVLNSDLGVNAFDGDQAFFMEDVDGKATLYFDYVDLTGTIAPSFSMRYFLGSTNYEAADLFHVRIEIDQCPSTSPTTVTVLNTGLLDIETLNIEGSWNQTPATSLTTYIGCRAQLVVEFDVNASDEEIALDAVEFSEGTREAFTPCNLGLALTPTPSTCTANNGRITTQLTGAAPGNVSYVWSDGPDTNPNRNNLAPGTYTLTVTDQAGCIAVESIEIETIENDIAIMATPTPSTCTADNGVIVTQVTGQAMPGPLSYAWSDGPIGNTFANRNNLAPGEYTVTVTDPLGCTAETTVEVTVVTNDIAI